MKSNLSTTQYVILFMWCWVLSGCKKDIHFPEGHCYTQQELPQNFNLIEPQGKLFYYKYPVFNPGNNNEFLCLQINQSASNYNLVSYNIATTTKHEIYGGAGTKPASWSIKDWVAFEMGGDIYKVKSNGDSLVQLTFSGQEILPVWNKVGTGVAVTHHGNSNTFHVLDEEGLLAINLNIDIPNSFSWGKQNGLLAYGSGTRIFTAVVAPFQPQGYAIQGITSTGCVCWLDSNTILYSLDNNIYKLSIPGGSISLLKQGCANKSYDALSVSGDGEKILVAVKETKVDYDNKVFIDNDAFYLMNADGSNETRIELPIQ